MTDDAVRQYLLDAARFRLMAFDLIDAGDAINAEGALGFARLCEQAAEAEDLDPAPKDPGKGCVCFPCRWQRLQVGQA